jgi:hypothetical protein
VVPQRQLAELELGVFLVLDHHGNAPVAQTHCDAVEKLLDLYPRQNRVDASVFDVDVGVDNVQHAGDHGPIVGVGDAVGGEQLVVAMQGADAAGTDVMLGSGVGAGRGLGDAQHGDAEAVGEENFRAWWWVEKLVGVDGPERQWEAEEFFERGPVAGHGEALGLAEEGRIVRQHFACGACVHLGEFGEGVEGCLEVWAGGRRGCVPSRWNA